MATKQTIAVRGIRELGESLKKLELGVRFKLSRAAVRAGAGVIRKFAQQKVPIGKRASKISGVNITPGNLKRNIIVREVKKTSLTAEYEVAVRSPKRLNAKQKASGKVGAFYWRFVEFGTSKMAARPFMRQAAIAGRSGAIDKIKANLQSGIEREAAKAAGGAV